MQGELTIPRLWDCSYFVRFSSGLSVPVHPAGLERGVLTGVPNSWIFRRKKEKNLRRNGMTVQQTRINPNNKPNPSLSDIEKIRPGSFFMQKLFQKFIFAGIK